MGNAAVIRFVGVLDQVIAHKSHNATLNVRQVKKAVSLLVPSLGVDTNVAYERVRLVAVKAARYSCHSGRCEDRPFGSNGACEGGVGLFRFPRNFLPRHFVALNLDELRQQLANPPFEMR